MRTDTPRAGWVVSHPRCMLFDNRKHYRSGYDVGQTLGDHQSRRSCREIAERVSTQGVVAVGVGPTGEECPDQAGIFAFC